jgi:hypothetical protein
MVKHFNYTFTYLGKEITISESITDRDEDRDFFKPVVASDWMTQRLRSIGLFANKCVYPQDLVIVKKRETVKYKEAVAHIKEAEEEFKNMPSSIDKVVIAMANAHGVTI